MTPEEFAFAFPGDDHLFPLRDLLEECDKRICEYIRENDERLVQVFQMVHCGPYRYVKHVDLGQMQVNEAVLKFGLEQK